MLNPVPSGFCVRLIRQHDPAARPAVPHHLCGPVGRPPQIANADNALPPVTRCDQPTPPNLAHPTRRNLTAAPDLPCPTCRARPACPVCLPGLPARSACPTCRNRPACPRPMHGNRNATNSKWRPDQDAIHQNPMSKECATRRAAQPEITPASTPNNPDPT